MMFNSNISNFEKEEDKITNTNNPKISRKEKKQTPPPKKKFKCLIKKIGQ